MAKNRKGKKQKPLTAQELTMMQNKGAAAAMVRQPCFKMRVVELKNKPRPDRKRKHKGKNWD